MLNFKCLFDVFDEYFTAAEYIDAVSSIYNVSDVMRGLLGLQLYEEVNFISKTNLSLFLIRHPTAI
jgi:hypothetical protein